MLREIAPMALSYVRSTSEAFPPPGKLRWYWLMNHWGCGAVVMRELEGGQPYVVGGAPIFKSLNHLAVSTLRRRYGSKNVVELPDA